jgi:hypothetical protein
MVDRALLARAGPLVKPAPPAANAVTGRRVELEVGSPLRIMQLLPGNTQRCPNGLLRTDDYKGSTSVEKPKHTILPANISRVNVA